MATYRSAMGKPVDMAALSAKNERVRAVGNMQVNARGDTIDANGKVIVPATDKVNSLYSKTVGNRAAQVQRPARAPDAPTPPPKSPAVADETFELSAIEKELESSIEEELEIEHTKSASTPKAKKK